MNKKVFIEKIKEELEKRKIPNRDNFLSKSFAAPNNNDDGEMTLVGAQIAVVLADSIKLKYKFYKIDEKFLQNDLKNKFVEKIKEQYPGIIFYVCDMSQDSARTIDTENNMIIVDNENFDVTTELYGDVNKLIETML